MDSSITSTVAKAHDSSNASVFVGGFWRNRLSGVYIEYEQRGLEARRDQQVLEVLVAAVVEEVDDLLRWKRSVKRSSDSSPPHTKHTKTAVPQITD